MLLSTYTPAYSASLSHGCCRHCAAVGRFSGAKSRRGFKKSANPWASDSGNLYLSARSRSSGQNFSLWILFRPPYLSKKSFDWDPAIAIWTPKTRSSVSDSFRSQKQWKRNIPFGAFFLEAPSSEPSDPAIQTQSQTTWKN